MPRKPTEEELLDARGAYVLYVTGEEMIPRYRPGDRIAVNPGRKPELRQDCVIVMAQDGAAFVKEFRGEDASHWLLWEHHPPPGRLVKFEKAQVKGVYAVVGRPS